MGCCVSCVCVFACLGEVLRVFLFGDGLLGFFAGFVDAFGFCGTVRVIGCW